MNTKANVRRLNTSIKSNLAIELEKADLKLRELRKAQIGDTTDEKALAEQESELLAKKLTKDELFARRKELAYLKMRESQKSAKARMQNKIKSKKYHKLQKRQKIIEQMKEFELLQKTNPEAALEKLNALEKSRVQERASLRHKNTGTWAKNLQVRAKYDKEVRKDLAEQLAVSRELTQKKEESDSEEETRNPAVEEDEDEDYDPFNPWTKGKAAENGEDANGDNEDPNWRKHWTERNENEKLLEQHRMDMDEDAIKEESQESEEGDEKEIALPKRQAKKPTKKAKVVLQNGWQVEKVKPEKTKKVMGKVHTKSIEDIFDEQNDVVRATLTKKLDKLKKQVTQLKKTPVGKKGRSRTKRTPSKTYRI